MNQIDWVSGDQPQQAFRDIRNTRPSAAEEKALIALELGRPINSIPPFIKSGGTVADVRDWKKLREECAKVAKSSRASVQELRSACSRMRPFFERAA